MRRTTRLHFVTVGLALCAAIVGTLVISPRPASAATYVYNHITNTTQAGFDPSCAPPTTAQMQTWWTYSPYWWVAEYTGGSALVCPKISASWVSAIKSQGWKLVPIWAGPQSYCHVDKYGNHGSLSNNPTTAYNTGVSEAGSAVTTAQSIGVGPGTIIYYDFENYDTTNSTCVAAANQLFSGWTSRLHALGYHAGVYSNPSPLQKACSASITEPDDIWIAKWDNNSAVYGLSGISDSCWAGGHRLHQYTGTHNETYGGVTLGLDKDSAWGDVASA